jgi:hypothetical protein
MPHIVASFSVCACRAALRPPLCCAPAHAVSPRFAAPCARRAVESPPFALRCPPWLHKPTGAALREVCLCKCLSMSTHSVHALFGVTGGSWVLVGLSTCTWPVAQSPGGGCAGACGTPRAAAWRRTCSVAQIEGETRTCQEVIYHLSYVAAALQARAATGEEDHGAPQIASADQNFAPRRRAPASPAPSSSPSSSLQPPPPPPPPPKPPAGGGWSPPASHHPSGSSARLKSETRARPEGRGRWGAARGRQNSGPALAPSGAGPPPATARPPAGHGPLQHGPRSRGATRAPSPLGASRPRSVPRPQRVPAPPQPLTQGVYRGKHGAVRREGHHPRLEAPQHARRLGARDRAVVAVAVAAAAANRTRRPAFFVAAALVAARAAATAAAAAVLLVVAAGGPAAALLLLLLLLLRLAARHERLHVVRVQRLGGGGAAAGGGFGAQG